VSIIVSKIGRSHCDYRDSILDYNEFFRRTSFLFPKRTVAKGRIVLRELAISSYDHTAGINEYDDRRRQQRSSKENGREN
jgi:hypothetical protein